MTQEHASGGRSWSRLARKIVVAVVGFSVLGLGIALIVLPGPAVVVIPLGLAILGKEFLWARRLLRPILRLLSWLKLRARRRRVPPVPLDGVGGQDPGGPATAQPLGHEPVTSAAVIVTAAAPRSL
jgi:hypothetical protein